MKKVEGFIVYALEEGGLYHVTRATRAMFDETVASGEMLEHTGIIVGGEPRYRIVKPAYIAWAPIEADFDFVLGSSRDDR
jgi:hypothetical protein